MNLIDLIMNLLSYIAIVIKLSYHSYMTSFLSWALEQDKFVDWGRPLYLLDIMNNIDAGIYLLIAISFMKTLVFWLPHTFKIVTDLLGEYFNKATLYLWLVIIIVGTLGTSLLLLSLGPFIFGFQSVNSMTIRSSILLSQGWFWQVSEQWGI